MREVLILGYGNPLRGDDAFGCYVAEQLETEYRHDDRVRIIPCHQLTPDLAETLSHYGTVVFIDASCGQVDDGVRCVQLVPENAETTFSHHVTPSTLLIACEILYGCQPRAYVLSITGQSFELGEEISPRVHSLIPDALSQIRTIIDSAWRGEQEIMPVLVTSKACGAKKDA